jgi:hypothetical protein
MLLLEPGGPRYRNRKKNANAKEPELSHKFTQALQ